MSAPAKFIVTEYTPFGIIIRGSYHSSDDIPAKLPSTCLVYELRDFTPSSSCGVRSAPMPSAGGGRSTPMPSAGGGRSTPMPSAGGGRSAPMPSAGGGRAHLSNELHSPVCHPVWLPLLEALAISRDNNKSLEDVARDAFGSQRKTALGGTPPQFVQFWTDFHADLLKFAKRSRIHDFEITPGVRVTVGSVFGLVKAIQLMYCA